MGVFADYVADVAAGMRAGVVDVVHHAGADISDSYQEILMSHASISPPDGLATTTASFAPNVDATPDYTDAVYIDVTPSENLALPSSAPEGLALPPPEIDIA